MDGGYNKTQLDVKCENKLSYESGKSRWKLMKKGKETLNPAEKCATVA